MPLHVNGFPAVSHIRSAPVMPRVISPSLFSLPPVQTFLANQAHACLILVFSFGEVIWSYPQNFPGIPSLQTGREGVRNRAEQIGPRAIFRCWMTWNAGEWNSCVCGCGGFPAELWGPTNCSHLRRLPNLCLDCTDDAWQNLPKMHPLTLK